MEVRRIDLEAVRASAKERYGDWVALGRSGRGRQKPRDRDSVLLLIELAKAAWKRAEAEGRVRWREDGVLEIKTGLPPLAP